MSPVRLFPEAGQLARHSCSNCGLGEGCIPRRLEPEEADLLDAIRVERRPIERGATLFHAGSPCRSVYVVRSGCVMCVLPLAEGDSQVLAFRFPGDILGLSGVGGAKHGCTAVALERSRICEVPIAALHELAANAPSVRNLLERLFSNSLQSGHQHVALMGKRLARERLATFLLMLSDNARRLQQDPERLRLSMSRSDIASYLGLALETVSRLLTRMQDQGLIEVDRRSLRLLDLAGLRALAEGEPGQGADEQRRHGPAFS